MMYLFITNYYKSCIYFVKTTIWWRNPGKGHMFISAHLSYAQKIILCQEKIHRRIKKNNEWQRNTLSLKPRPKRHKHIGKLWRSWVFQQQGQPTWHEWLVPKHFGTIGAFLGAKAESSFEWNTNMIKVAVATTKRQPSSN